MKYPNNLNKESLVGITALSSGASDCIDEMNQAINNLRKHFNVIYTDNIYGNYIVSSSKEERIKELNELLEKDINSLIIARGGDYLADTLDSINYQKIYDKGLLVGGMSDPTSLLYILTTKYDLATYYGINGKRYAKEDDYILNNIKLLKGENIIQKSYKERNTISLNGDFKSKGIIIGGCIDTLRDHVFNTEFDNTLNFIEKYKEYNIVWYFDNYALTSSELFKTLKYMKENNYFKYSNTFIFGNTCYTDEDDDIYIESIKYILKDSNIIFNANIGHIDPVFTIINGSLSTIEYKNKELTILQERIR